MVHTRLSAVVTAVRLRYAILFVFMLVAVYWLAIHPWMTSWGSTAAERQMVLPGDELHPNGAAHATYAITINASPAVVWQWLAQVGQDRAGFYTYTWLENLTGANIHNTNEIRPEWQRLAVGDLGWRMLPADYLGGVGKDSARLVRISEPGRALVLDFWGAHIIQPIDSAASTDAPISRLIVRGEAMPDNPLLTMLVEPAVFTMEKRMLLGLKARAEGRPDAPVVLMAAAWFGWVAAGIGIAGLFLSQRRRWPWLALPILATLPALLMAHDIQAGLVAFLAAGISILGFLIFGKRWWGSLLILGSLVMLTLLLAPEAFTAYGVAFIVLLLAVLGMTVADRESGHNHALSSPREVQDEK